MSDAAVKITKDLARATADLSEAKAKGESQYPAFDDLLMLALERRYLEIPEFTNVVMEKALKSEKDAIQDGVRLFKVCEISYDKNEPIHLPGVESVLTSMRGRGYSLVFIVQGDVRGTSVYFGISRYAPDADDISAVLEGYEACWRANFPGTRLAGLNSKDTLETVSFEIGRCKTYGMLTGIPALKRDERGDNPFVQGLERLVRAMRGKNYTWLSIADPIPSEAVRTSVDACRQLQSDVHHFVNTQLSKAVSNGKTVMLGMFGMLGQGITDATADTKNEASTSATSQGESTTDSKGSSDSLGFSVAGGVKSFVTASAQYGHAWMRSTAKSVMSSSLDSLTKGWANTISHAISNQLGGGGFLSFGQTWTKTTTVGQELLNRKAQYAEQLLQKYEERLSEGAALGMWNLGHYFCAGDEETYNLGCGVVSSLFSGMDSRYEPPRAIRMPETLRDALRRFQNVYLGFADRPVSAATVDQAKFYNHPLGAIFNGPTTPVNTRELAVATPLPKQDVEGVTVVERTAFAVNSEEADGDTLTLGVVQDRGNETKQRYRLKLPVLQKHLGLFGLTGSGKTNTVHHLLRQLWKKHHIPFLVIEPAKTEYRALGSRNDFNDDLLVFSAGVECTEALPLRLNPFDFDPGADCDANRIHVLTHIDRLKAIFNASFPMYASMPYILEEAILEVYRERGWDLGHSRNRHIDIYTQDFRDYLPTLRDLYLKIDTVVRRKGYFQEQQMNIEASLKARLSSLMVGSKGIMLNCAASIPAADLFERPTIIELENLGDDDEKAFLMGLLVTKLYEYRKSTFGRKGTNRMPQHLLVIEEAHRLLKNVSENSENMEVANVKGKAVSTFCDMLSEIRAMNQGVLIVDQLPSRVSSNVIKGTGTKIVHRLLAKDDRESVGWTMGLNADQVDDIQALKTGECVVNQDGDRKTFICKVPLDKNQETTIGCPVPPSVVKYKVAHKNLFPENSTNDIDDEDCRFKEKLHKAMLAVAFGTSVEATLGNVHPSFILADAWTDRAIWFSVYWRQIIAEIWQFYGGNFALLTKLSKTGEELLEAFVDGGAADPAIFSSAAIEYFKNTREHLFQSDDSTFATAYAQLLLRFRVMTEINRRFYIDKDSHRVGKLENVVRNCVRALMPDGLSLANMDNLGNQLSKLIMVKIRNERSVN